MVEGNADAWKISYEMYKSGKTLQEIASERGITVGTVAAHLMRYVDSGDIDPHNFVDDEIVESVCRFKIENPKSESLKDIYEALNETVPYEQIRFALKCLEGSGNRNYHRFIFLIEKEHMSTNIMFYSTRNNTILSMADTDNSPLICEDRKQ